MDGDRIAGYKINGLKQWISNGGIADAYTILAATSCRTSWFIVEKGAPGFKHDKPEDKHGIRLSNTAALALDNVYVDADRFIGGVEGQGLNQAQAVFGYTRLMVAAFGLGAGWAALDRAIPYSAKRIYSANEPVGIDIDIVERECSRVAEANTMFIFRLVMLEALRAFFHDEPTRPEGVAARIV